MKKVFRIASIVFLALSFAQAEAQVWPDKPVKFIVPTPAGSSPDIAARIVGEKLSARWGQAVVIENRVGAGGIPAMSAFTRSAPDGYTLGFIHSGVIALTPHLFKNPQFNIDTEITTISTVVSSALLIVVNPSVGVNTLPELIKLAKAKPGKLVFGAPLLNSVPQLTGDLLARNAGIDIQTVPYSGAATAVAATVSGNGSDITIDAPAPLLPFIKSGKLKALAVTSPKRSPSFDQVPTVNETLPGFESFGWFALFAPAKTPAALVDKINRDVTAVLAQPDTIAKLNELSLDITPNNVVDSAAFVNRERERWKKIISDAGIKPE